MYAGGTGVRAVVVAAGGGARTAARPTPQGRVAAWSATSGWCTRDSCVRTSSCQCVHELSLEQSGGACVFLLWQAAL